MVQESWDLLMKRMLLLFGIALTVLHCASVHPLQISALMESLEKYEGRMVVITAYIQSAGPHGTLLVDNHSDPKSVLSVRVERPRDSVEGLREATTMMIEDETREVARGVKGEFAGVLHSSGVHPPVLVLVGVRNLRWGASTP